MPDGEGVVYLSPAAPNGKRSASQCPWTMMLTTRLNWTKAESQKKQKYIFEATLVRNQESGDDRKPQLRSSSVQSRTKAKAFSRGIN